MKKALVIACLAAALPMAGLANITINAYAQDGAIAYLYDSSGNTYGDTTFSSGQAVIDVSSLVGIGDYGLAIGYAPGQAWYSNIAWADGGGGQQYKTLSALSDYTVQDAISGAVTDRSIDGTSAAVTFSSAGPIAVYNNPLNELDAQIGLYRPAMSDAEVIGSTTLKRFWNASALAPGYDYEVSDLPGTVLGLKMITISNGIDFAANYAAEDLGGGDYRMHFFSEDKATAFSDGVISNSPGFTDVIFAVDGLGSGTFMDDVPYYAIMDRAWMYDVDGNYSEAYDAGLTLESPDQYNYTIPEPAVIMLLLGGGGVLLGVRRFFMV